MHAAPCVAETPSDRADASSRRFGMEEMHARDEKERAAIGAHVFTLE